VLQNSFDFVEAFMQNHQPQFFKEFGADDGVGDARFIFDGNENIPFCRARPP
jgi:hypothetical protein